tara:strand:- start:118 stop:561 length:444 start_codon:yes stop_codon:yes gene_type:complete
MKGLFFATLLVVSSFGMSSADAHDGHHKGRPYTTFKVLRPVDVFRGVGGYCKEATEKAVEGVGTVLRGTGEIITAPFKSRIRMPQMRHYRWYRGHWHEVKPTPKGVRPQDLKVPEIDMGEPESEIHFIPTPYTPEVRSTIALLEFKF